MASLPLKRSPGTIGKILWSTEITETVTDTTPSLECLIFKGPIEFGSALFRESRKTDFQSIPYNSMQAWKIPETALVSQRLIK